MAFFANLTSWLLIALINLNLIPIRVLLWQRAKGMSSSQKADLRSRLDRYALRASLAKARAEYDEVMRLIGLLDAIPVIPDTPVVSSPPEVPGSYRPIDLAWLRKTIARQFNKDDLRTLASDLGIEHENLPETKDGMARELVAECVRRQIIPDLVAKCRELRPQREGEYQRVLN